MYETGTLSMTAWLNIPPRITGLVVCPCSEEQGPQKYYQGLVCVAILCLGDSSIRFESRKVQSSCQHILGLKTSIPEGDYLTRRIEDNVRYGN